MVSRVLIAALLVILIPGCGGGSGGGGTGPTNPSPSGVPTAPTGLSASAISMTDKSVSLVWMPSTNATSYVIDVGRSTGSSDVTSMTTAVASATVRDLPAGLLYFRVKARNDAGLSGNSNELALTRPDLQDYIDAIFLGSGPLRADPPQCPRHQFENPAVWAGFPRGTTIRSPMTTAISGANQALLRATVDLIPEVTHNAIRVNVELTEERAIVARPNESPFAVSEELTRNCSTQGCCAPPGTIACASAEFVNGRYGVMRFSKSIFLDGTTGHSAALVHEIGHAILGMCHISAEAIGGRTNPESLMASSPQGTINLPSRLTPFDIEAAQAIYGSPLSPGASRAQLAMTGVVKP